MKKALFYITLFFGVLILFTVEILPSLPFLVTAYFIYQDQFNKQDQRSIILGTALVYLMLNLFIYSFEDVAIWAIVFFVYLKNK
jgi:hypothetical protein